MKHLMQIIAAASILLMTFGSVCQGQALQTVFPDEEWITATPAEVGLNEKKISAFVQTTGRLHNQLGCIVKDGYMVTHWGDYDDGLESWLSAWKPQITMAMFHALEDKKLRSLDQPIATWLKKLYPDTEILTKDLNITFRQLANQVSGYGFENNPGESFAYNDSATALSAKIMTEVLGQNWFGYLSEKWEPLKFQDNYRVGNHSARDFARLGLLWLNKGRWNDQQILPERYFEQYVRPGVPPHLPDSGNTHPRGFYLSQSGSPGGYSAQGVYGFWFWFNNRTYRETGQDFFPGLPNDTFAAYGYGNHFLIVMPRLQMVVAIKSYSGGTSGWKTLMESVEDIDTTGPNMTESLQAKRKNDKVRLNWQPAEDDESSVDAYYIYRDGYFLDETSQTEYIDKTASNETTHTYEVQPLNTCGFAGQIQKVFLDKCVE